MLALSLRQPWAALVLYYGKVIENRRWKPKRFRGEFLIHAAKDMEPAEFDTAFAFARRVLGDRAPSEVDLRARLLFGCVVGRARLVEVVRPRLVERDDPASHYPPGIEWRWHIPEQYGLVLADVAPVTPFAYRGMPGFFKVDMEAA